MQFSFTRSFVIGIVVAVIYLLSFKIKFSTKTKWLLTFGLIAIFTTLVFVKTNSSLGRLLIYKVTFTQLKAKDYIYGLGIGKFKATYNQLQAAYFTTHNINSNEALLAGNGYYLFNDWLQAAIEVGLIGLCILVLCIFLFLKIYKWQPKYSKVYKASNAVLICISTAALFNYPLQSVPIFFIFILALIIHFHCSYALRAPFNIRTFIYCKNTILISVSILCIFYCFTIFQYKKESKAAFELSNIGYKNEADSIYNKLENTNFADYNTKYNYVFMLYMRNDLPKALIKINEALQLAYSLDAVKLKADILMEQNKYIEAEKCYTQAVYIVPNKMQTKYNLMQFYIKTKQIPKAKYWANVILTMPIKVPSPTINYLLNSTKKAMDIL